MPGRRHWSCIRLLAALAATFGLTAGTASAQVDYDSTRSFIWPSRAEDVNTVLSWEGVVEDAATGLPKVVYADGLPHWNPCTVALWGLQEFNRYVTYGRRGNLLRARKAGDWLTRHQRANGAWMYDMAFTYRLGPIAPGWVAGQAQGNAISLLVRLYAATDVDRYLYAAVRARTAFQRPISEGGTLRRFRGHTFIEAFPTAKPSLTLEDYQLSILGLYDLGRFDRTSRRLFRRHMRTLTWALPLYEGADGRPQFDLGHRTVGAAPYYVPEAHVFNASMLLLLAQLSHNAEAKRVGKRWMRLTRP